MNYPRSGCDYSRIVNATATLIQIIPPCGGFVKFDIIIICPQILLQGVSRTETECLGSCLLVPLSGHCFGKHCLILPSTLCSVRGQASTTTHVPRTTFPRAPSAPSSRLLTGGSCFILLPGEQPLHPPSPQPPGIAANPPTRSEHSTILPSEQGVKTPNGNWWWRAATAEAHQTSWPRRQRPCSWARASPGTAALVLMRLAGLGHLCVSICL